VVPETVAAHTRLSSLAPPNSKQPVKKEMLLPQVSQPVYIWANCTAQVGVSLARFIQPATAAKICSWPIPFF
jgi:hypothetical protein